MNKLFVILCLVASNCSSVLSNPVDKVYYEDDSCFHQDSGRNGVCIRVSKCASALQDLQHKKPQHCSFKGTMEIVCCPDTENLSRNLHDENEIESTKYATDKSKRMCEFYGNVLSPATSRPPASRSMQLESNVLIFSRTGAFDEEDAIPRIYGGQNATAREFPHMAAIGYGDENDISWSCGGSLISEQYVLTAAHCLQSLQNGIARWVQIGSLNLDSSGRHKSQQFEIVKHIVHPGYQRPAFYNDIALLQLNQSAQLNDDVRPACLHSHDVEEGKSCIATGWGVFNDSSETSKNLLKVDLLVQNPSVCNVTFAPLISTKSSKLRSGITSDSMICAGAPKKDTCSGDSGGPIQLKLSYPPGMHSIIGVTSFGTGTCGTETSPAVYMRVSYFLPWIVDTIWPRSDIQTSS